MQELALSSETSATAETEGPGRFRDPFEPEPWARRLRWLSPRMTPDPARVERLRAAHFEGDPKADALVGWMHEVGVREGRRLFDRALEQGITSLDDAPAALRVFFAEVDTVPAWLDRRAIARACDVTDRAFLGHDRVLFSLSLLSGYVSSGIAKTLAATGQLETMAPRRLAETASFVNDVYRSRTLGRETAGFRAAVRVRLMHAFVRHQILHHGSWDAQAWGLPINQADMVATVLQFSSTYLLGLRLLGFWLTRADREAVVHTWRYLGRLMGVDESLLPATEAEGIQLLRLSGSVQAGPDEDSRALARALLAALAAGPVTGTWSATLLRMETAFRAGLARFALGAEAADRLALPRTAWRFAPLIVAPLVSAAEAVRVAVPGATRAITRVGRQRHQRLLERVLAGVPATFEPRAPVGRAFGA